MTEKSFLWTTGGAGDGGSTYTSTDWSGIFKIIVGCDGVQGVAPSGLNLFAGTATGANTVQIDSGRALVDGKPYHNTAAVNVTIPSAVGAGNTRIDRIVLRADWTAQTVRITRIAGTDAASPTAPAITQSSGVTYDIQLYQALVNTSGTVTLTDERTFARILTADITDAAVTNAKLATDAVTQAKVADAAIGTNELIDLAVTAGKIANATITGTQLASGAVTAGKIGVGGISNANQFAAGVVDAAAIATGAVGSDELASGAVIAGKIAVGGVSNANQFAAGVVDAAAIATGAVGSDELAANAVIAGKIATGGVSATAQLANDIVDDTKVGNRVPMLANRKGGSTDNWNTTGTNNYTPTTVKMQAGTASLTWSASNLSAVTSVSFPAQFGGGVKKPLVIATIQSGGGIDYATVVVTIDTPAGFSIQAKTDSTVTGTAYVSWLAIGEE